MRMEYYGKYPRKAEHLWQASYSEASCTKHSVHCQIYIINYYITSMI